MKRTIKEFISDAFEKVRIYEFSSGDDKKYVMISNSGFGANDWYCKYEKQILNDLGIENQKDWVKKSLPVSIAKKMEFPKFEFGYNFLTCEDSYGVTFPLLTRSQKEKKDLEFRASFGSRDYC